jgi:hypothetical protein
MAGLLADVHGASISLVVTVCSVGIRVRPGEKVMVVVPAHVMSPAVA